MNIFNIQILTKKIWICTVWISGRADPFCKNICIYFELFVKITALCIL